MNSRHAFNIRAVMVSDLRRHEFSLADCGLIFRVSKDGVRKLEARALRLRRMSDAALRKATGLND